MSGFGPQLQNHGQIDDVHGLFVNEHGALAASGTKLSAVRSNRLRQLFGFRAGAIRPQNGASAQWLALQKMLSDGCYQRGLTTVAMDECPDNIRSSRVVPVLENPTKKCGEEGVVSSLFVWGAGSSVRGFGTIRSKRGLVGAKACDRAFSTLGVRFPTPQLWTIPRRPSRRPPPDPQASPVRAKPRLLPQEVGRCGDLGSAFGLHRVGSTLEAQCYAGPWQTHRHRGLIFQNQPRPP